MYDRYVKGDAYHVNDMVFLHCPAIPRGLSRTFHKPWHGPYRVVKIIGPTVYRIADCTNPRKKKVVNFNRLKRAPIGKVPEHANGEDMVEGARNDILPVGPVPGNRNGNDLMEDSLEEETVGTMEAKFTMGTCHNQLWESLAYNKKSLSGTLKRHFETRIEAFD